MQAICFVTKEANLKLGQFFDLMELFRLNGLPTEKHYYLFNGDFVDRGSWSTEIALLLYAYKWLRPGAFFINRGNHETDDMNRAYGFEGECKHKYNGMFPKIISLSRSVDFHRSRLQALLGEFLSITISYSCGQEVSRPSWWLILRR